jgi:hypothetical protein
VKSCTYLGLEEDRETVAGFPSTRNLCYRPTPPCTVAEDHQRDYCLACEHVSCSAFTREPSNEHPTLWTTPRLPFLSRYRTSRSVWVLILATSLLVFFIPIGSHLVKFPALAPQVGKVFLPIFAPSPTPSQPPPSPTALPKPAATPTLPATPSLTPRPTLTPSPTAVPGFALETPALENPRLVLHKVVAGEGFTIIAAIYKTSEAAIRQINIYSSGPLWLGSVIVLPLDQTNIDSLPVFEVYQITKDNLTLESLAQEHNLSLELLCKYNQAHPGDILPVGRWLLLPLGPP